MAKAKQTDAAPLVVVIPVPGLVIVSEQNRRDHWATKRRRARDQAAATHAALCTIGPDVRRAVRSAARIAVRFVRIGGKRMDSDNLAGGFKAVRDALAAWVGVDDGSDVWVWDWPVQECGERGIRIEIRTGGS